jgi:DNA invertase Pin-like site-specific DNA recombinase
MARKEQMNDQNKVILYVRVSTDEQALGPTAQRAAAERWCAMRGATLAAVYEDLGVSGGAPIDKCPGLLEAIDAIEEHGAGVLLVAKRDRLARDVIKAAMIEQLARRKGATVASAAGEGEGDDPASALMRTMIDAFAQYERALIGARTRAALAVKKAKGQRVGRIPFGHRLAADGVTLEEDAREQDVIRACKDMKASGMSLSTIATELDKRGMSPRDGAWYPMRVQRVLA